MRYVFWGRFICVSMAVCFFYMGVLFSEEVSTESDVAEAEKKPGLLDMIKEKVDLNFLLLSSQH